MTDGWGFAALCDEHGQLVEILRDGIGLLEDSRSDLIDMIDSGDRDKFQRFISTALMRQAAFDWPINVMMDSGITTLHFGAAYIEGQVVVIAAENRADLSRLGDHLLQDAGGVSPGLRKVLKESARQLELQAERDAHMYDELTRLNNDLATTERRLIKANVQLTNANEQLNAFYEALPLGVFRTNREGILLQANALFHKLAGANLNSKWYERVSAEDRKKIEEQWLNSAVSSSAFDNVNPYQGADDMTRTLRVRIVPLHDDDQKIVGYAGAVEDVSSQLRAERQERLAARHSAIREVTSGFAHHLNNIMAVTLGTADELVKEIPKDNALHESARMNLEATRRAAAITGHLMTYAGISVSVEEPVVVNDAVESFYDSLGAERQSRVELAMASEPTVVNLDEKALTETLRMLTENAFTAIDEMENGSIKITTSSCKNVEGDNVKDVAVDGNEVIMIEVSDNGVGMDAETLERAKEPFFTTQETGGGIGLGLSFADGFARSCEGELELTSQPGQGTRVRLKLPTAGEPGVGQ